MDDQSFRVADDPLIEWKEHGLLLHRACAATL
jgi:hypothetical protein